MDELIVAWGMEGDEGGVSAARLSDLVNCSLPKTDYYPVRLRQGCISIVAGYDCPVEPLQIMTPDAFLAEYPSAERLPDQGEVMEGISE